MGMRDGAEQKNNDLYEIDGSIDCSPIRIRLGYCWKSS